MAGRASSSVSDDESPDRLGDELDRNGREQESEDSREQVDATGTDQPRQLKREPEREIDENQHSRERTDDREPIAYTVGLSDEHDDRRDRAWSGDERHEGDVDLVPIVRRADVSGQPASARRQSSTGRVHYAASWM
jgi:hypothetical protein